MEFRYYVLRRILLQIIIILGTITITFFASKAIPGDPVAVMLGLEGMRNEELVEIVTKLWKLDEPLWVQYVYYMKNFLTGNLGRSTWSRRAVAIDLAGRFPATVELTIAAFIIAMAVAIPAGVVSAIRRGSKIDAASRLFSITGISAPSFWWGVLFLYIFYLKLRFVGSGRLGIDFVPPPFVTGMYTIDSLIAGRFDMFLDALKHLILPAITLGMAANAMTMRLTRSSMLEIINSDYIRTARMKGLRERVVIFRHALRNAIIPTVTYAGILFGAMLGGAVLTETIFNIRGMGSYAVYVLFANDFPGILGVTFVMAIVYSTVNLIVDLLYALLDPRVRVG